MMERACDVQPQRTCDVQAPTANSRPYNDDNEQHVASPRATLLAFSRTARTPRPLFAVLPSSAAITALLSVLGGTPRATSPLFSPTHHPSPASDNMQPSPSFVYHPVLTLTPSSAPAILN